jgi:hypothetical protein
MLHLGEKVKNVYLIIRTIGNLKQKGCEWEKR